VDKQYRVTLPLIHIGDVVAVDLDGLVLVGELRRGLAVGALVGDVPLGGHAGGQLAKQLLLAGLVVGYIGHVIYLLAGFWTRRPRDGVASCVQFIIVPDRIKTRISNYIIANNRYRSRRSRDS
jgi:hypothetical protein